MPYKAKGKCVYRKDTGKKIGCTKGDVNKYLVALHTNVVDEKENIEEVRKIVRKMIIEMVDKTFDPKNPEYLDAWLNIGDEDEESYEEYGLIEGIPMIIDEVKKLKFPLRIYRGINYFEKSEPNLIDSKEVGNVSWTTSRYVAERFGNVVYTGIVMSPKDINLEYTIKRRIIHKPLDEDEIIMKDNKLIKNVKRFK